MKSADREWEKIVNNRNFPALGLEIVKSTGKYVKLSLKDKNASIHDAHPVQLGQVMKQYFAEHDEQTRMRNAIMLKTKDDKQFVTAMNLKQPVNVTVKGETKELIFEEMISKNISKGIVFENSWMQLTTDEIKTELNNDNQKVREVKQMTRRNHDKEIENTNRYIITFDSEELPERVKLYGMSYRVRQYYPNPLICVKCLKVGHIQAKCNQQDITCRSCGRAVNDNHVCQSPPICPNCPSDDNQHAPNSKECPRIEAERLIIEYKTTHRVSYGKAREMVEIIIKNGQANAQNQWTANTENNTQTITNKQNDDYVCQEIIRLREEIKTKNERIAELERLREELKQTNIRLKQVQIEVNNEQSQLLNDNTNKPQFDGDYEMEDPENLEAPPKSNKRSSEDGSLLNNPKIKKREIVIGNTRKKIPQAQGMVKTTSQNVEQLDMDDKQLEKYNKIKRKAETSGMDVEWYDDGKNLIPVEVPSPL